ncbi:hypothetical protein [Nocardiopsis alkaliphila]|uniref:hypothetical protein n=1 Tax=Nocardiopsis alkaliphila TaxID=225762 RepID=UPI000349FADD|nr:hypothetical protein [Nocardiopsis alkaliphila]
MAEFWTIEGIDGAGKSHLLSRLATTASFQVTALRKDAPPHTGNAWLDRRLAQIHDLTWGYDHAEPVWNYPANYWLHSLAAWYALFYHAHVAPALDQKSPVVVDGWYFKHQARMTLSGDDRLVVQAEGVFSALPQPDRVVLLTTPAEVATTRRAETSKPSEHGAFTTKKATTSPATFTDYQTRTAHALEKLLSAHPAPVHALHSTADDKDLLSLLRREVNA